MIRVNDSNPTISSGDISTLYSRCTILLKMPRSVYSNALMPIPSYYDTMITSKAAEIRENMAAIGTHGDTFVFITDFHINDNTLHSPALIKYLMKNCGISNVVFGGDSINSEISKADVYAKFELFMQLFRSYGIDLINVVGNHEFNNPNESADRSEIQLSNGEVYPFFLKKEEANIFASIDADNLVYYIDNNVQKIRYIYVPCDYAGKVSADVSTWVRNALGNTIAGYSCVIIAHRAIYNGSIISSFADIANAFDGLIGTSVTPVCIICGHSHEDMISFTTGGIPIIATTCDSHLLENGSLDRTTGTPNEQAFDVFQIDTQTKTIKIVRIGAGENRTVSY